MSTPKVTMDVNMTRLNAAIKAFVSVHGPNAADKIVRKASFDVIYRITTSLNGLHGTIKRIDTGRYRAGWNLALVAATGQKAGPTSGGNAENPQKATDGQGKVAGKGLLRRAELRNNVEYGPYIEYGTATMAPGQHVTLALEYVAKVVEDVAKQAVIDAARGRL